MIVKKSALLPYSASQMYALVNDVDSYPEFLPWCRSGSILEQSDTEMRAAIELAKGPVRQAFTTRNALTRDERITLELVEGPFQHLHGEWLFKRLNDSSSKIMLEMDFEFSTGIIEMAFAPIFKSVVEQLIDAFCKRAVEVYGA